MDTKTPPDITALDIANWFLARAYIAKVPVTLAKLQSLVYFAFGWYSAFYDDETIYHPLFAEPIHAGRRGPSIQSLYDCYKAFGNGPILVENLESPPLDTQVIEIVESIWKHYFAFPDDILNKTIRCQPAWRSLKAVLNESEAVMSPKEIRRYFQDLLTQIYSTTSQS